MEETTHLTQCNSIIWRKDFPLLNITLSVIRLWEISLVHYSRRGEAVCQLHTNYHHARLFLCTSSSVEEKSMLSLNYTPVTHRVTDFFCAVWYFNGRIQTVLSRLFIGNFCVTDISGFSNCQLFNSWPAMCCLPLCDYPVVVFLLLNLFLCVIQVRCWLNLFCVCLCILQARG